SRREETNPVVPPVPAARELGDRHRFDSRYAESSDLRESFDRRIKGAFIGEGADVHLIDDEILTAALRPSIDLPFVRIRIDDDRWAMHPLGLATRSGVRID